MRRLRFLIPALSAVLVLTAADAYAQSRGARPVQPDQAQSAAPKRPARPPMTRAQRIEGLYEALKIAPSAQAAQVVEARLEATLMQSGSDTADLLMTRARGTMEAKDYDLSLELLNSIIELSPAFTEAYAQRATVYYLKKETYASLADLRVVIAREPRHYGALAGLGVILQDIGDEKRALDAFRRAKAQHPHIKGIGEMIKRLETKVDGREI